VSKHSELGRELIRALTSAKVNVLDESDTILGITKNNISKRVLSLDSAGRANQYEISYQLSFSLVKKTQAGEQSQSKGKQQLIDLIPAQSITQKREYLFDADLVLVKTDEENRLYNDMRQAAILQLIRRLSFSLKRKIKTESKEK
jgi:LPS-assembly lipoprotein